jgi:hypothetical protein
MALDVYVGPLSRYYSFTWETIIQQTARQAGEHVIMQRPPGFSAPSPAEAHAMVLRWRTDLERQLGSTLGWDESVDGEYVTDKPDWGPYHALRYLALHDEFPDLRPPRRIGMKPDPRSLDREPLERRFGEVYLGKRPGGLRRLFGAREESAQTPKYPHLQMCQMWIPADFQSPIVVEDPFWKTGRMLGSVGRLRAELQGLQARTPGVDDAALRRAREDGPDVDGDFEAQARFGFAVFLELIREASNRGLPMAMDS